MSRKLRIAVILILRLWFIHASNYVAYHWFLASETENFSLNSMRCNRVYELLKYNRNIDTNVNWALLMFHSSTVLSPAILL